MAQAPDQMGKSPLEMPFPFYIALAPGEYQGLSNMVRASQCSDESGLVFFQDLPAYTAALPFYWQQFPDVLNQFLVDELVDKAVRRQMEKATLINWSSGLSKLEPLQTTGDGNCLLHAAALYMWGIEDADLVLRNSLYQTLNNGSFATTQMMRWQHERSSTDQEHMPDFRYNTMEWGQEFDMIKSMASPEPRRGSGDLPYQSLEEFHIYTLANILRRPIMVLAHNRVRSVRGASLQPQSVSGLYLPLHWDPAHCCKSPIVLGFQDSHFFPLMHTSSEEAKDEVDVLVSLVLNTPLDQTGTNRNSFMTVHFRLPQESDEDLARRYLDVDTFIHCVSNKMTAIGLPGARLGSTSLEKRFSVWDVYFEVAERNLRAYYEREYNPGGSAEEGKKPETGAKENQIRATSGNIPALPNTSRPSNRKPGQCKTPSCPFQQSLTTGDLCFECFSKGNRSKCQTQGCMNKEDVGLGGFCKVCHEKNKFQQEPLAGGDPLNESGSSEGSSSPTNGRFKETDLTSLAVDTINAGMAKCIIPECQLTGNPHTGDMCKDCYAQHLDLEKDYVVVNPQGEEDAKPVNQPETHDSRRGLGREPATGSDIHDRRAELMTKLGLEGSKKPSAEDRSKSAYVISGQRGGIDHQKGSSQYAAEGATAKSSAQRGRSQSAAISTANFQAGGNDPAVGGPRPPSRSPVQTITVKKDLCATPGCPGVHLKDRDLCRKCVDRKKQPSVDDGPGNDNKIHPEMRENPPSGQQPCVAPRGPQAAPRGTGRMPQPEHWSVGGSENGYRQEDFQQPPAVNQAQYGGLDAGPYEQRPNYGQPPKQQATATHYQEARKCKIRRCGAPASPPDYKYCEDCLEAIQEDYIAPKAAPIPREEHYDTIRSAPPTAQHQGYLHKPIYPPDDGYNPAQQQGYPHGPTQHPGHGHVPAQPHGYSHGPPAQHQGYGPAVRQKTQTARGPDRREPENIDMTHNLEQQLRDQYRPDRSDAEPPVLPQRKYAAPPMERKKCQGEGGCPMYGSPETGGMCSKCWRAVGAKEQTGPGNIERHGSNERHREEPHFTGPSVSRPAQGPGNHQQTQGRDRPYQNYRPRPTQPEQVYQELGERCAQPDCVRPAAENVEKFCEQCHKNYQALFTSFRQINTA